MKKVGKLFVSTSKIGEIVRSNLNETPMRIPPGGVFDGDSISKSSGFHHFAKPINSFYNYIRTNSIKKFFLERTFSLGDLLMLVPVYRALIRDGFEPYIRTAKIYQDILSRLEVHSEEKGNRGNDNAPGVFLDYVVEKDHTQKHLQKMHRVEIYHRFLDIPYLKSELDWSMKVENFPETSWDEKPYVVFQGRGAVERRGLSTAAIQEIIYYLNAEEINCVYIGERLSLKGDPKFTKFQFMNSTLAELFSWIHGAKYLITMDSSPLWISHFTNTPTCAILGPSRPQERISLHSNASCVKLNEWIKCESCFEQSKACDHRFDCLHNVDATELYKTIRPELKKYWED